MNKKQNIKRVFIVGSPRSGTTLLQGVLSAHPAVFSLPETFFFAKVLPRSWLKRHLLWPAIKVRAHFLRIVKGMERPDLLPKAKVGLFQKDYYQPFINVMDQMTLDEGKSVWVEKTPWHLYCIEEIQRVIPDVLIIHIVRDGRDVVASLVKATRENPEQWAALGGKKWKSWQGYSIDEAIQRWNKDINISKDYVGKHKNLIVKYEDLIRKPNEVSHTLCQAIGFSFDENMSKPFKAYNKIVNANNEPWKVNNAKERIDPNQTFQNIFTEEERSYIESKLVPYDVI